MREKALRLTRWQIVGILLIQLLAVGLLFGMNFSRAAKQEALTLPLDGFAVTQGQVPVSQTEEGVTAGPGEVAEDEVVLVRSASFSLPRGSYRVTVTGSADHAGSSLTLMAPGIDEAGAAQLSQKSSTAVCTAVVTADTDAAQLQLQYGGGTAQITSVTAQPTADLANRPVLALCLVLALADLALWLLRHKTKEEIGVFAVVAAIGLFASLPFLLDYITWGLDLNFHLTRIEGIKDALLAGQFPVRLQEPWYEGAGYPVSVMYGDLFLYFPAVLRILGASLPAAFNAFRVALNLACAGFSYYTFKRIFHSTGTGLLGAGVYTLCLYRFTNLINRAALGEAISTVFFPLVLLGLCLIYFERETGRRGWLWLCLGLSGMINSHILSCEMAAGVIVLWALCFLRRTFRTKTLLQFVKAGAATLGLNLWFLLPFLDYSRLPFQVFARGAVSLEPSRLFLPQLFGMFPNVGGYEQAAVLGYQNELGYSLGGAMLIGVFALLYALYLFWGQKRTEEEAVVLRLGAASLAMSAVILAAAAGLLPLDFFQSLSPLLAKVISVLQVLSRLLSPLSLTLTLAACCAFWLLRRKKAAGRQLLAAGVCLCSVVSAFYYYDEVLSRRWNAYRVYDASQLLVYQNHNNEYLYQDADRSTLYTASVCTRDKGVRVDEADKDGLSMTIRCANTGDAPGRVITPLLHYPYYRAVDTATGGELALGAAEGRYLQVELPAGFDGEVTVFFREPAHWRLAEAVSLVTAAGLLFLCRKSSFSGLYQRVQALRRSGQ